MSKMSGLVSAAANMFSGRRTKEDAKQPSRGRKAYDPDFWKPVLKCSICNGEQVAGFKDLRTGKFEEITLIRGEKELEEFMKSYGIDEISKEY